MRGVIFANGNLNHPESIHKLLQPADLLIAADGGGHHFLTLGLTPAVIIGDCDSIKATALDALVRAGAQLIRHPVDKDQTDLELALDYAIDQKCDEILVFGALGGRWDQSLANLLLTGIKRLATIPIRLIDGPQTALVIRGGETLPLTGAPGDTISLIPLASAASGIYTTGLQYPLADESLPFGTTRGISNRLQGERAEISLAEGLLICIHIRGSLRALEERQPL
jgi:thiamine pyrophosphokinase